MGSTGSRLVCGLRIARPGAPELRKQRTRTNEHTVPRGAIGRTVIALFGALLPLVSASPITAQSISEFSIPTAASYPATIAKGADGNLWFTEYFGNNIGMVTTAGVFTEYVVPTASSTPFGITAGPDANLWFTENAGNKIGRLTTAGVFTEYAIPTAGS